MVACGLNVSRRIIEPFRSSTRRDACCKKVGVAQGSQVRQPSNLNTLEHTQETELTRVWKCTRTVIVIVMKAR